MPYLKRKDYNLFYKTEGDPDAPVLMFSHSLGSNLEMWEQQIEILKRHFHILRYDHPGHGKSDFHESPLTVDDLGGDALALLDELNIEKTGFCGLSLGGMIGLWLAANAPERISRMAICSTAAKIEHPELLRKRINILKHNTLEAIADNVVTNWFTDRFLKTHPEVSSRIKEMFLETKTNAYSILAESVCQLDLTGKLGKIDLPVLIIYGKHDKATPPEWNIALNKKIRDSKILALDASHMANIEAADKFTTALKDFFNIN